MQLIGMLDSPYVRRTAISLRLLGVPFEHRAVSVFATFAEFQRINPLVKAPSLVCDDGEVLMDSSLIVAYAERLAAPGRSLLPREPRDLQHTLRIVGLALAACEKCVQSVYERNLRPESKWHHPWLDRVHGQALAGFAALEAELCKRPLAATAETIDQGGVTAAVLWRFAQAMVPEIIIAPSYPLLAAHSRRAEALAEFAAFPPDGPGVPSK
jgi:glutathione S-transferase